MTTWVVVPVKPPDQCKTRLRSVLPDAARRALAGEMLRHVLDVAGRTAGVDEIVLLGSPHDLASPPRQLPDPGAGLNAALASALQAALAAGVNRLVLLSADLPLVTVADVAALIAEPAAGVAIAPDRWGTGTNALSLLPAKTQAFCFHYGSDSFARHIAEAVRLGLRVRTIRSETLAFDVDEPRDLAALAARHPGSRVSRFGQVPAASSR